LVNLLHNRLRVLVVDSASKRVASSQQLLNGSLKGLRQGSGFHDLSALDDLIKGEVTVVLDVLDLLSISGLFVKLLHEEGGGRGEGGNDGV
jgi:hypothetical protein